jgi:hypothetical protein
MTRGIDQLLCADAANADETKGLFDWFDPALLGAFNRATRMFDWFTALIEHHGSDGEDLRAIHQCRAALGARDGAELTAMRARLLRSRQTLGERPRWGDSVNVRKNPVRGPYLPILLKRLPAGRSARLGPARTSSPAAGCRSVQTLRFTSSPTVRGRSAKRGRRRSNRRERARLRCR